MRLALALPVLLAACTVTRDHAPDSAAPRAALVPSTATPTVATVTAASVARPSSPDGSEPLDPRYANPDSAIRRYLEDLPYTATGASPFGECPNDMGIEHESIDVAAVSLRPLRRTHDSVDSAGFNQPLRTVEYRVVARSVALLDPAESGTRWRAIIAPRTDTFDISLEQWVPRAGERPTNWMACTASKAGSSDAWSFLHANRSPDLGNATLQWTPADGSWERVRALADSAAKRD